MSNQHCPGFENNKTLSEVTLQCPDCSKTFDIFSDELEKTHRCPACQASVDPQKCQVS